MSQQKTTTIEVTPAEARHLAALRSMAAPKRVEMLAVILHMAECLPKRSRSARQHQLTMLEKNVIAQLPPPVQQRIADLAAA